MTTALAQSRLDLITCQQLAKYTIKKVDLTRELKHIKRLSSIHGKVDFYRQNPYHLDFKAQRGEKARVVGKWRQMLNNLAVLGSGPRINAMQCNALCEIHSLIVIREVLILTLSIFIALWG